MASLDALGLKVLLTKNIRPDGTLDLEGAKKVLKENYRKIALAYHPDHNPGNALAEELFKQAAEQNDMVQGDKDDEISKYILEYIHSGNGNDEILGRARDRILDLIDDKNNLEILLQEAQTNILTVANGGRRQVPEMIVVYQKGDIKITLANAATEIPKLIAGKADPALEQRLNETLESLRKAREEIDRTRIDANQQNRIAQDWQRKAQDAERAASSNRAEAGRYEREYTTQKARADDLDTKYKAALRTVREETEARAAQERKAASLEETLRTTTHAGTTLMTAKLAEQKEAYEARIATLEAALPSDDPTETILQQKAASGDAHTQYQLAQYLITRESVKITKNPRRIKQAEDNIKKALKSNYQLLEQTITLARQYQLSGQDQLAVGIMKGVYGAVDDTREREVRLTGGLKGYHAYNPQFSALITALIDQKENSTLRRETRGRLTQMVQENPDFEEPLYQAATALRLQKEFDLAEEMAITLANASNKAKYWTFIGNVINDSPTGKRPDRVQWAQECYSRAKK